MMFELMTGTPPFGNHGGVLQKNGADIPIIEEDYSQELKDIVYSCLALETWDRPSAAKIEEITYNKIHGIAISAAAPIVGTDFSQYSEVSPNNQQPSEEQTAKQQHLEKKSTFAEQPKETSQPANGTVAEKPSYEKPAKGKKGKGKPVKEQPKPVPPAQPQVTPQPQVNPQPQVSSQSQIKPLQKQAGKKSGRRLLYGGLAIAALIIGSFIAMCGGGDTEETNEATAVVPSVNYDSLALVNINKGLAIAWEADTFMTNHPDDMIDEKYPKVEEILFDALMKFKEALQYKDNLSPDVASSITSNETIIKEKLHVLYKELMPLSGAFSDCKDRTDTIAPYIRDLIENEKNQTSGDNNEETF